MSSGLVKAKKYDWKDSNLAMFGSDTEKQVKKESAESEPAWAGAGQEESLKIWRIVKFQVEDWPKEDYGKFFSGDSYIILNTYKPNPDSEELAYDVHFWIGKHSTQDEYGTAAYKTVELDTFLDDAAIQHREVQGKESDLFSSYFKNIQIMAGGADTGFRHVEPEQYKPRLLHFSGQRRAITVTEVPLCESRLNSGDVFILDLGMEIIQWNGSGSNKDERFKAMMFMNELKSERGGASGETIEEEGTDKAHKFYEVLVDEDEEDEDIPDEGGIKNVYRIVSDASGSLEFTQLEQEVTSAADLDSGDVFVIDTGSNCFVWVGGGASSAEKKNGFGYAHKVLQSTTHSLVPVVVVKEGQRCPDFETAIAA